MATAPAYTPRSRMDKDGTMRWRCSTCATYRPENEMLWGLGDESEEWPPWRVICWHCRPVVERSPRRAGNATGVPSLPSASPRAKQTPSPRRLTPLVRQDPASAGLPYKDLATAARKSAHLRPSELRSTRSSNRHALVTYREDGQQARGRPHVARRPIVAASRLRKPSKNHRVTTTSNGGEAEDPREGNFHPQVFFTPKLTREELRSLLEETNMTRTELYRLFNRFKALCQLSGTPGSINKKTFKEGVSSLAFEDQAFCDRVFQLLDEDGSGTVEWEEFVNTVNALETGSPHDKLRFCFQVYDNDGNESIERSELHSMFTAMLMGDHVDAAKDEMSPELNELIDDFVDSIYDTIDADKSGSLEFEEVLDAIQKRKITDVWEIFGRTLISNI